MIKKLTVQLYIVDFNSYLKNIRRRITSTSERIDIGWTINPMPNWRVAAGSNERITAAKILCGFISTTPEHVYKLMAEVFKGVPHQTND